MTGIRERRVRGAVERWASRWWAGEAGLPGTIASVAALPLELAFRVGVSVRNRAYDRGWIRAAEPPIPVVSVGNLTVGGTGKTPVAAWIARTLADGGARPAVVVRGDYPDEVALHRRWNPHVPVLAARRRIDGVRRASDEGASVAVLDDGFQHRALARDLDLVLIPGETAAAVRLLPRGPGREPGSALARADLVVRVARGAGRGPAGSAAGEGAPAVQARLPGRLVELRLEPAGWLTLVGDEADAPDGPALAVAGLARPRQFFAMVERVLGRRPEPLTFPDHHAYGPTDVEELGRRARGRVIVTTEKDAVKLSAYERQLPAVRVLALRVAPGPGADDLRARVLDVVRGRTPSGPPRAPEAVR